MRGGWLINHNHASAQLRISDRIWEQISLAQLLRPEKDELKLHSQGCGKTRDVTNVPAEILGWLRFW